MKLLNNRFDLDTFFDSLRTAAHNTLCVDYDGTLAPFRAERNEAIPYSGVRERLARLIAHPTTSVVVVSGRGVDDLVPLLGLPQTPEIWGSHGAERRSPDGTISSAPIPEAARRALEERLAWAETNGLLDRVEKKPVGLAFHWRGLDEGRQNEIHTKLIESINDSGDGPLVLHEFDGGLEFEVRGINKGQAVHTVVTEGDANMPIAYLGDDLTDEHAFHALEGRGLRVLVREQFRQTAADLWLVPPGELLDFLDQWLDSVGA